MRFRAATVGALAATLLVTVLAVPASAQVNPPPSPKWPDGSSKTLHLLEFAHSACNIPSGVGTQNGWGHFYLHADANDRCAHSGPTASGARQNVPNGNAFRIPLLPGPTEVIPLVPGAKVNLTIWVGYGNPNENLPPVNSLNFKLALIQGAHSNASAWTGIVEPTDLVGSTAWYKVEASLDPPGGPQIRNTTDLWHLEIDQNGCLATGSPLPNATCLVAQGGINSVGFQYYPGYEGEHASTIELPIPNAFVSGKPWPPINCAVGEVLNLTTKKCDPLVVECPTGEALNETSGLCEAIEVDTGGPDGGDGNVTGDGNLTNQGNDTTNETKDKGLPSVGTVGLLAATFVAFAAAARRRRDE